MNRLSWSPLVLLSAALFLGCESQSNSETLQDGGADAAARPPDASLDASQQDAHRQGEGDLEAHFCRPLAEVLCGRAAECGCGVWVAGGQIDVAACTESFAERCALAWEPLARGARIDRTRVLACVAQIESSTPSCEEPHDALVLAHCAPFAAADAPIGAECDAPLCAEGTGYCREGTCVARLAAEESCASPFDCETGTICLDGACAVPGSDNASCRDDLECTPTLHCIEGRCRALAPSGAVCESSSECALGLSCAEGRCHDHLSEACASDADCGHMGRCVAPRVCAARASSGEPCSESRQCAATLFCSSESRTCIEGAAMGEACAERVHCAPGLGCDADGEGHCVPLPGAGGTCLFGPSGLGLCAEDLGCTEGVCGALPMVGAPCTTDNRCAEGLACDFARGSSVCITPRGEGEACATDLSCASGLHCGPEGTCRVDFPAGSPCRAGNECAGVCVPGPSGSLQCADVGTSCLFDDDCGVEERCSLQVSAARCIGAVCSAL